jgi:hypothetical protein
MWAQARTRWTAPLIGRLQRAIRARRRTTRASVEVKRVSNWEMCEANFSKEEAL